MKTNTLRPKLKQALSKIGYEGDSIKSLMSGRMTPILTKAIQIEDLTNVPPRAWLDIKSYLQDNNTKQSSNKAIINE